MPETENSKDLNDVNYLTEQLTVARTELSNLRQKLQNMMRGHYKDIEKIRSEIRNWRCSDCKSRQEAAENNKSDEPNTTDLVLKPIGVIKCHFPNKKGTPRQPSIVSDTKGQVVLYPEIFSNAEHALEGLDGFSHMWIIFHFHKNASCARTKVAPPRLNGLRVGVFSSRSPHRPNPVGMSLVRIDRIDGATVQFYGVDMVDGTPVLDIKPYIPCYDSPDATGDFGCSDYSLPPRLLVGADSEWSTSPTKESPRKTPTSPMITKSVREAPDGEEGAGEASGYSAALDVDDTDGPDFITQPDANQVRVPDWINQKPTLTVTFTEKAIRQIADLDCDKKSIADVLRADPRSVYLRRRYGGQCFAFLMLGCHVTCRFRDDTRTCHVIAVRRADIVSEGAVIAGDGDDDVTRD